MALTNMEKDAVTEGAQTAKKIIREIKPMMDSLNIIYDREGGLKSTITQEDLDSVSSWSGLTKQQLDDGMYAVTTTLRTAIINAYSALAELAARA